MSIYMSRLLPKSNSSFQLCSGLALKSEVLRLREKMFVVDAGIGTPRTCLQDELTGPQVKRANRFENKVGFLDLVSSEQLIQGFILERCFIDLVAGDPQTKERAVARFNEAVGSTDVVPGEPHLVLPRNFRKKAAWMELKRAWRTDQKVRGFVVGKIRGGYSVAIGGYVAFLPYRNQMLERLSNDQFRIEKMDSRRKSLTVY